MTTNRHILSWLIIGVIAVVVLWSIINITATARHYHNTGATWLLGIAFGLANAISVYAWATASTTHVRRPAILGAILFGLGSAIIQTSLYRLEHAAWPVAIAFGSMGPLAEALLAWLEAAMRTEIAANIANEDHANQIAALTATLATATAERDAASQRAATLQSQLAASQPPTAASQPPPANRQPAAKLTAKQIAMIRQIADIAATTPFATDAELAESAGWSDTTARRYRNLAEEHNYIRRNGDDRYHPVN